MFQPEQLADIYKCSTPICIVFFNRFQLFFAKRKYTFELQTATCSELFSTKNKYWVSIEIPQILMSSKGQFSNIISIAQSVYSIGAVLWIHSITN